MQQDFQHMWVTFQFASICSLAQEESFTIMSNRDTELLAAAREGDIGRVARWLRLGANVDAVDSSGSSALSLSALEGHVWVVSKLLDANANLELRDARGRTNLLHASAGGHAIVVQKLIDAGADVNARDSEQNSALILAAANGHASVVQLLLQSGADPDTTNADGETAMAAAQANSHSSVAQALGEVTETQQQFFRAVVYGNTDCVRRCMDRYLHARGSRGCSPVLVAAQHNQFEILKLLVFRGANIHDRDDSGWTALHFSAQTGNVKTIEFLLAQGADPSLADENGVLPVFVAAMHGHVDAIREFHTSQGGDSLLTSVGWIDKRTALHHAATSTSARGSSTIEYILSNVSGIDIDGADVNGWTALHLATQSGSTHSVELLLRHGANVNILTKFDDLSISSPAPQTVSALHLAVQHAHLGIVRLLLSQTALDPDVMDLNNETPLLQAVLSGQTEIAIALVEGGANPDSGDDDGRTPLLVSSRAGSHDLVKALLQHGACVDVMSKFGETPIRNAPSGDIQAILQVYQSSQRFHSRCMVLMKQESNPDINDFLELVPLITSVYDLRLVLAVTSTRVEGSKQLMSEILQNAFTHVLYHKLVIDDNSCVFFRLVLEHCVNAKLLTPSEYIKWKVQSSKVNMESAEWVVELKRQVYQNSRRLGLHDQSIRMVTESMKTIHAITIENRKAVLEVKNRVADLEDQVEKGKLVLAKLASQTQKLTGEVERFQDRLNQSEQNIVAVASSLQNFRSTYANNFLVEKKKKMMKMGCGLVASLVGFAFAPVLKEVFDSVIDLANPIEIFDQVFTEGDVVAFLADQASENILVPALEEQLAKYAISREEFETSLRQEIIEKHPELLDECAKRGVVPLLDEGDACDIRELQPQLETQQKELQAMLSEMEEQAKAFEPMAEPSTIAALALDHVSQMRQGKLVQNPELDRPLMKVDSADKIDESTGTGCHPACKTPTQVLVIENASDDERIVFVDDLHDFPYHYAVYSSNGNFDEYQDFMDVVDANDDPNAAMRLRIEKATCPSKRICAAEYAFLLGYRDVGEYLAQRMPGVESLTINRDLKAVSVTLVEDTHDFPFIYAVQESKGDLDELDMLLEVIDVDEDAVDAAIEADVVIDESSTEQTWSAVELACHLGYTDIVKHLLVKKKVKTLMKSVVVLQRARARAKARLASTAG